MKLYFFIMNFVSSSHYEAANRNGTSEKRGIRVSFVKYTILMSKLIVET